jgi:hypothetical protein
VGDAGNRRDVPLCGSKLFADRLSAVPKVLAPLALEIDMEEGVVPGGGDNAPGDGGDLVSKKVGDQPQVRLQPKFLCLDLPILALASRR